MNPIISVEDQIIKGTILALLAEGYSLGVYDGEETTLVQSTNNVDVFNAMKTTDEDYLLAYREEELKNFAWVRFVYGNEGYDVINDYSLTLEKTLLDVNAAISEYENREIWHG